MLPQCPLLHAGHDYSDPLGVFGPEHTGYPFPGLNRLLTYFCTFGPSLGEGATKPGDSST